MIKSTMLSVFSLVACFAFTLANDVEPLKAGAVLTGNSEFYGIINFTQQSSGGVLVEGFITGLRGGQYGFHIHEKGDMSGDCYSTGGHYNPEKVNHGAPDDRVRHVGDLGNIEFDEYRNAHVSITNGHLSLTGPYSILGRAAVLHGAKDDLGRGTTAKSVDNGNEGRRVACGVIGILSPVDWPSAAVSATASTGLLLISALAAFYQ